MEKLRILIANKFFYPRGGDCVVAMNLERLLRQRGHDVAVFAMQYPENVDSGWNQYYASQVEMNGGITSKFQALKRIMGCGDVKASFNKILNDFKPDIVHLHNIHSYLSPVLAQLAKRRGCQVVWTMHDYKLVCPSYSCLLEGMPCERCIGHSKMHVLKTRCMKSSLAASAVAFLEARKWNRHVLENISDAFICPSHFMASKMRKDGFNPDKLHVVCNHIDPEKLALFSQWRVESGEGKTTVAHANGAAHCASDTSNRFRNREEYYIYVGRLSPEKGVETLLNVASKLPFTLKVAGDGPLSEKLRQQYSCTTNIEFLGRVEAHQVAELLCRARLSVVPSEWYENNPLSVIESLCAGTPVVGALIGGIPELLSDDNGITFTAGNCEELSQAIKHAFVARWDYNRIMTNAIQRFSPSEHIEEILRLYGSIRGVIAQ